MAQKFDEISTLLAKFIEKQNIFFVATAAAEGRINLSPKGMDTLRILGPNRVAWLNLTGSGNETAAHLPQSDRMTLMFCAFEGKPLILRLYGKARAVHPRDSDWHELVQWFPPLAGTRQVIDLEVDLVQTSCGMGVPLYDFRGDREQLIQWAEQKGAEGIEQYWRDRNRTSIDGKPTQTFGPPTDD